MQTTAYWQTKTAKAFHLHVYHNLTVFDYKS
jgi:hypothetical protein